MKNNIGALFLIFGLLFFLFTIFSYSQVDLNLTLARNSLYLSFQERMTELGYFLRPFATVIFVFLTLGFYFFYVILMKEIIHKREEIHSYWWKRIFVLGFILWLAYPAFSHDIFNYLFNAKMVWVYHRNPHVDVAATFVYDVWLRFMHNVHTPAPYAYGWTVLSLLPGVLTIGSKLKLSLWGMKLFIGLFWLGQLWILKKIIRQYYKNEDWRWFLFALNPLVLIETLAVGHNDVVMMFLALFGYWFLLKAKKVDGNFLLSLFFLGLSISIKYATLILLPLWLIKVLKPRFDFPFFASLLLAVAMFLRPDQLHSWYLIWAFSWVILAKRKFIVALFSTLSLGALLRYAPFLYYGKWDPPVYFLRNVIWLTVSILIFPIFLKLHVNAKKTI